MHKKNFLIRGPLYDNGHGRKLKYFESKGVEHLFSRLMNEIQPFMLRLKYNKREKTNNILIEW